MAQGGVWMQRQKEQQKSRIKAALWRELWNMKALSKIPMTMNEYNRKEIAFGLVQFETQVTSPK